MSSGLPAPPPHLTGYALEEWHRLATGLNQLGLLNDADRMTYAAYCSAYSRWRHAEEQLQVLAGKGGPLAGLIDMTSNGNRIQNVLVGISNRAAADMVKYAAEFGLTPSARARLAVDSDRGGTGKFSGLLGRNG